MRTLSILLLASVTSLFSVQTLADDNCGDGYTTVNFNRNDLVVIKQNVSALADALGKAPAPYAKDSENWQLPTYACQGKGGYRPVSTEYTLHFTTDAAQKKIATEYQQKMMAAEAKGDMQAVIQISQQYQKLAMQSAVANQNNSPIDVDISANSGDNGTIDPGAVVRDGAGFIALRQPGDATSSTETISIYFDKVALKNAHEAASFDEQGGEVVVPGKLDTINARINISGPKATVESMVKQMNAGAALGKLSEKRTKTGN